MVRTLSFRMSQAALAAALALAAVGAARADDSSMNPFTGDSYAYFNGGYNRPAVVNPTFANPSSAWQQANPNGLPEKVLQAYSAGGPWRLQEPTYASAPAAANFRETHPNGLTERELQALSSEGQAWHLRAAPGA
jgi:hypothetical protein